MTKQNRPCANRDGIHIRRYAIEIHEYCIIFGNSLQSRTFVHVLAVIFVPKFKYNYIGV